jgi:hypothetical protein
MARARDDKRTTDATYFGDGDVEVYVHAHDRSREEHNEHRKGCVFKVSHLNLHTAELDTPADGRLWGRRLESQSLPVRRLDVLPASASVHVSVNAKVDQRETNLEMVGAFAVVLVNKFRKYDDRITNKQVGKMLGKQVVDSCSTSGQPGG